MPRPSPSARSRFHSGSRGFLLLSASALASACLVSFDGYEALGTAGSGGTETSGGQATAGKPNAGSPAKGGRSGSDTGGSSAAEGGELPIGGSDGGSDVGGTTSGSGGNAGDGGMAGTAMGGTQAGGSMGGTAGTTSGGTSGSSGTGGNGGSGGNEPKSCPVNLEGPPLIEIPKPGGGFYCMDRTEITNDQYAAFLASNPSPSVQDAVCSWNATFAPDTSDVCAPAAQGKYDPIARPKVPVGCIDWCDAKRYCAWAGKRLCGAIAGGANPPASFADASASQWFRACSKAGTQKFPYGNQYNANYCNGADIAPYHPSPVASLPNCIGGYGGLFDMSGNVAEWEDSCSASSGAGDNCLIRGGNIDNVDVLAPSLLCNSSASNDDTPSPATAKRNARDELIGFRCCLDP